MIRYRKQYLKGLATSTNEDAKVYFGDLQHHLASLRYTGEPADKMIQLAFAKDKANDRKSWLQEPYDESFQCDFSNPFLLMEEWFSKEFIHHPHYNCRRAIPSLLDGFKDVQRKILHAAMQTKASTDEVKVTQLAGATSEKADYHHGETSCEAAIVHLAQRFVGSNNVNLLEPNGQFGTRLGNDVGASRYLMTKVAPIARRFFRKDDDGVVLFRKTDNGHDAEPVVFLPPVPLLLINGAIGIGTGWSTSIPMHDPFDVLEATRSVIQQKGIEKELEPKVTGWTGTRLFERDPDSGIVQQTVWIGTFSVEMIDQATTRLTVTELPPAATVNNHKQHMLNLLGPSKGNCIVGTLSCSTDNRICEIYELDTALFFETVLQWDSNGRKRSLSTTKDEFISEGCKQLMNLFRQHDPVRAEVAVQKIRGTWFDNKIKLVDTTHMSNMWAFDQNGRLQRYPTSNSIVEAFVEARTPMYRVRYDLLLKKLEQQTLLHASVARFCRLVLEGSSA